MPTHAKSYENTYIYKIVCKDANVIDVYVGHTTDFRQRKRRHKIDCIKFPNRKIYQLINENGGWDNWDMIIIEKCNLTNVEEAKLREHYWYDNLRPSLNNNMPLLFGFTKEEVVEQCLTARISVNTFKNEQFKQIVKKLEDEISYLKNIIKTNNITIN